MKQFLIEIRPKKKEFDPLAGQVQQSLIESGEQPNHAKVQTERLYRIEGPLNNKEVSNIAATLLVDPVVETAHVLALDSEKAKKKAKVGWQVSVWPKTGVTDPVGETVEKGLRDLGFSNECKASSATRYIFSKIDDKDKIERFTKDYLANGLIHNVTIEKTPDNVKTIPLRTAGSEDLEKISREGLLSLSLQEMKAIQAHFVNIGRDPSDVELETLAQTWSEHCVHKTFKGAYRYQEKNAAGSHALAADGPRTIDNLLKETVAHVTDQLNPSWCLSVFKDNAGVIELDETDSVSFKVETHNHPSALEPYGGAGTGIGGVIRDVMGCGLGGKPVLNTDVFCFGNLDTPTDQLPHGALHPKRIAKGVIAGVRDYGNRMGIPTANGAITFDPDYVGNPLVFCGTVGLMPKTAIDKSVKPDDLVVVVGGRTGRDGIHGATFSSAPLESGITSNVVQIGHSIMEKKTMDVLLQARDKGLFRAITDCGAGGFSSAIGELGEETGVEVHLDRAPLKYQGLAPWEIWLSESQERMVLAVQPENWNNLQMLFQKEDVEAVEVGKFTDDKKLRVFHNQEKVAELDMAFLHKGIPKLELSANWDSKEYRQKHGAKPKTRGHVDQSDKGSYGQTLEWLLKHPIIASKESVIRQYDHEVQGGTVIKPLMGVKFDAPTDACVIRPKLTSWSGVAVSNGLNPEMGKWDPYLMALFAVDEAYRNILAVGGGLKHVAILDNFCWGDAKDPLELGALVRAAEGCKEAGLAYKLPFISGKDSFNNTWKTADGQLKSIPPTLLVSAIGVLSDVRKCYTSSLKKEKCHLYLVGENQKAYGGSLVNHLWSKRDDKLPKLNFSQSTILYKKLQTAMRFGSIHACHDISEGGIAVAAAEMAFGSNLGIKLQLPKNGLDPAIHLFGESPARFLVEVSPSRKLEFEQTMGLRSISIIGETQANPVFQIADENNIVYEQPVQALKKFWKESLKGL